jgi:hypothetical protein
VSARLADAGRSGYTRDVSEDQAAASLAERSLANQLVPLGDVASAALELTPIDPLGDAEVPLNLLRSAIEEETQLDHDLLALGKLSDDLSDPSIVKTSGKALIKPPPGIHGINPKLIIIERNRPPPTGTLTLIHRLVQRRLSQIRPNLRRAHDANIQLPIALLLQEHRVRIVKERLTIRRI